ncbi:hypothetical protein VTK73DRAFT_3289 [Phialemonium thermophilum]|uniref:DJ-1/PfpI domain-containing protein n=1 Tax=Phialemonium thermophilum TaxID=223376 RepID=A0ABR3Y7M1_9PEZI
MAHNQDDGPTVRIGVFLPSGAQVLDTACVDIFGMMSIDYLGPIEGIPEPIKALAPRVTIAYIGSGDEDQKLIPMTAGMAVRATHHLSDPAVGPGELDVVLVPGPDPSLRWNPEVLDWLRAHAERPGTDILSVCTGILLCGEAGLLRGRRACGPRAMQKEIAKRFQGVRLVGEELRWVQDGNFWSSGGITNGNDLVAAYALQSDQFPRPLAEFVIKMAEVGDRPQAYRQGNTTFMLGFLWIILKALVTGKRRRLEKAP